MLDIDIKTVLYLLALGNIFSIFLISAYYNKDREKHFTFFLAGKFFQSMAWILISTRGKISDLYSADIANIILYLGFAFESLGFVYIHEKRKIYPYILAFFVTAGGLLFFFFAKTPALRVSISSIIVFSIYGLIVFHILFLKEITPLYKMIGVLFGFFCAILLFRAYSGFCFQSNITLFSGITNSITFYALFSMMFTGSLGQILLLKQDFDIKMQQAATIDPLTNIFNRRYFISNIRHFMDLAVRNKIQVSFLMFDLDNFKSINDNYGHASGDAVLVAFSKCVSDIIRNQDIFARFGGEEFCLMTLASKENAKNIAERIRLAVEKQIVHTQEPISYTVSIGISTKIPAHKNDYENMIIEADNNLYQAKKNGRNQVVA